jgi:hypothetical protein
MDCRVMLVRDALMPYHFALAVILGHPRLAVASRAADTPVPAAHLQLHMSSFFSATACPASDQPRLIRSFAIVKHYWCVTETPGPLRH